MSDIINELEKKGENYSPSDEQYEKLVQYLLSLSDQDFINRVDMIASTSPITFCRLGDDKNNKLLAGKIDNCVKGIEQGILFRVKREIKEVSNGK